MSGVNSVRKGTIHKMLREASVGGVPIIFSRGMKNTRAALDEEMGLTTTVRRLTKAPRRKKS